MVQFRPVSSSLWPLNKRTEDPFFFFTGLASIWNKYIITNSNEKKTYLLLSLSIVYCQISNTYNYSQLPALLQTMLGPRGSVLITENP